MIYFFNNTLFQIDSLLIFLKTIYIYEVKNYQGNFYYDSDRLYTQPKSEINNPLTQLNRTESLLRQLLQSLGFHQSVVASVVFIHPEFTLYQAPLSKPFIYPSLLNQYFKKLNKLPLVLHHHCERLFPLFRSSLRFSSPPGNYYSYTKQNSNLSHTRLLFLKLLFKRLLNPIAYILSINSILS